MGLDILKFTELCRADTYFEVEITSTMQRLQMSVKCRRLTLTSSWIVLVVKPCKHSLPLETKIE